MNLFKFFFPKTFARLALLEHVVSESNSRNNEFRTSFVNDVMENQNALFEGLKRAHEIITEQALLLDQTSMELKSMKVTVTNIFDEQTADHDRLVEHGKAINGLLNDTRSLKGSRKRGIKVRDEILDKIETLEKARAGQAEINGALRRKVTELAARADSAAAVAQAKVVPPVLNTASVVAVSEMRGAYARDDVKSLHDIYTTILLASDRARFSFQRLVGKVVACGPYPEGYEDHKGRHIGLYCVDKLQPVFIALGIQHINPHHIAKDLAARK